jgi:RNA polymerase sigma factor (sigma-70 family)
MEFDTLSNYTTIAKKTISKFGSKMYPSLVKEMLSNDETVYEIAEAIMMADWNWDKDRKGTKSGKGKSLYSYRNQCAIWAIKTYVTQKYKKNKKQKKQMDHIIENSEYIDYDNPSKVVEKQEAENNLIRDVKILLDIAPLSVKQREQIRLYYYDDKTLSDIGKKYGVTREAVRQNINKGLKILKTLC